MRFLYGVVAFLMCSSQAFSEPSVKTSPVRGNEPLAYDVTVANTSWPGSKVSAPGDILQGSYGFKDSDGDSESNSRIQWVYSDGSLISGANGLTYKVVAQDVGRSISLQVTPYTDPAMTDPSQGLPASSEPISVNSTYIPYGIFRYDEVVAASNTAGKCESLGGRRLTPQELKKLYLTMTSANSIPSENTDLCDVWGWRLYMMCGAERFGNLYHTNTPGEVVQMRTGNTESIPLGEVAGNLVCIASE
ncbi:hypothetical protein WG219_00770 [Ectopseudomonas mendocina]|uniref:Uncharacterized protein n=1 Tax=Ectopseudomonas mendocina TaxID=300 RepID=A0ABZ2RJ19_ECTME